MTMHALKVGDRVRSFRKSNAGQYRYGTIVEFHLERKWVVVRWDDKDLSLDRMMLAEKVK